MSDPWGLPCLERSVSQHRVLKSDVIWEEEGEVAWTLESPVMRSFWTRMKVVEVALRWRGGWTAIECESPVAASPGVLLEGAFCVMGEGIWWERDSDATRFTSKVEMD